MRTRFVAGNWKMHTTHIEAVSLAREVIRALGDATDVEVAVCPPYTALQAVGEAVRGSQVLLGAQNMHWESSGAYTGEISPGMLLTLGCSYVILGHSERRLHFHETDEIVARKIEAALGKGLTPIVCVGETKEEREEGVTEQVIKTQIAEAFGRIDAGRFKGTVIAYEPVWAIGTGLTATADQAQKVHRFIRDLIVEMFGEGVAERTRILYGGSAKPENAGELFSRPDIDGGLIGGASLKAESFAAIVRA